MRRHLPVLLVLAALGGAAFALRGPARQPVAAAVQTLRGHATVADRLREFGGAARARLAPDFARIGVADPPRRIVLVGLKHEKRLEVWVAGAAGPLRRLKTYPILAASGGPGPKLREGDLQVPEGLYRIESLNPNSDYHVSLRVSYPNAFDRTKGALDGRANLGGDIMIHGRACSIGCLAMGDPAAEELFTLAAETGLSAISVILSPIDFRARELPPGTPQGPPWKPELYADIRQALSALAPLSTSIDPPLP